jgi:hypothetical protein
MEVNQLAGGQTPESTVPVDTDLWMTIFFTDGDDMNHIRVGSEKEMRELYALTSLNWSDVYLCKVIKGPTDVHKPV